MKEIEEYILKFNELDLTRTKYPYVLHFQKGTKQLTFFGSHHTFNPDDIEFNKIEEEFNILKPQILLWEGNFVRSSDKEIAKQNGEMAYSVFLANTQGISHKSLDVHIKDDAEYQTKMFDGEYIFAFFSLRTMNTMRTKNASDAEALTAVENRIKECSDTFGWQDFDFSMNNLEKIYENIFSTNLSLSVSSWDRKKIGPNYNYSVLNEIARSSSDYRNVSSMRTILGSLEEYDRVFAIMGGTHVYAQEVALRKFFS